jgi:hypothetical protein
MPSIRVSSTGYYSTITSIHGVHYRPIGTEDELSESTKIVIRSRLTQSLIELPSKGWLGKLMIDSIDTMEVKSEEARLLAERCWNTLTIFDHEYLDLKYKSLLDRDVTLNKCLLIAEHCWSKCIGIVIDAGLELIACNPAYLRSQTYDQSRFIMMTLSFSLESRGFRHRWIRVMNLLSTAPWNVSSSPS